MARGHVQGVPSDAWERDRTQIAGRWPEVLVRLDLAYWSDPICCAGQRRPSIRALAQTWGWSPSAAGRVIAAWDAAQQRDTDGTPVGQSRDTRPRSEAAYRAPAGHRWDTGGTPVGHAIEDTRARSSATSATSAEISAAAADARAREPAVTVERPAPRPGPASDAVELQAAELMALQEADEPQHGMRPPRDLGALRRALLRGDTVERLEALWAWSGVSDDPLVAGCRSGDPGWRRWSVLLKGLNGEERLQRAWAWHVAGRPTDAPARASPGRPRRQSALEMFEVIRGSRDSGGAQVSNAVAWFAGGQDG